MTNMSITGEMRSGMKRRKGMNKQIGVQMDFIIKKTKNPKLKNPVVIEGLPGIGNVARIAADFLIEKLKAKKFLTVYSSSFPNSVLLNDDSTVSLPKIEMYYTNDPDVIIIIGDAQPADDKDSYRMTDKILDILSEFQPRFLVTIGGIGLSAEPANPKVYGAVTDKKLMQDLKDAGVIFNGARTVGIIIGATGLLLGLARLKNMKAVSLLVQTFGDPTHFGFKASKQVLEVLKKYLGLKYSLSDIDKEIKKIEGNKKSRIKSLPVMEQQEFQGTRYIG
jgi:uncharacterized protein (TIGR00162 family)